MAKSMQKKTKWKLLLVQAIAFLPLLIFIFYLFDLWYDSSRENIIQQNIYIANLSSHMTQDILDRGRKISSIISENPLFYKVLIDDKQTAKNLLKNLVKYTSEIDNITILNPEGNILASNMELTDQQLQTNAADREYFQQVITTKKGVLSKPLKGLLTGKYIVIASEPLIRNNQIVAVVNTSIDLEVFSKTLEENINHNTKGVEQIILLDNERNIVFSTNDTLSQSSNDIFHNCTCVQNTQESNEISFVDNKTLPLTNEKILGVCKNVNSYKWIIITISPTNKVYEELFQVQSIIWLILLSSFSFAFFLITYYLKKIKIIY